MNMYVDDTAIDNDPERAAQIMTKGLYAIHNWCLHIHLRINADNTVAMFVSRDHSKLPLSCKI